MGALSAFAVLFLLPVAAHATYPGYNGRIASDAGSNKFYTANPDGSAKRSLKLNYNVYEPSYSADGRRIAFHAEHGVLEVMNADGSGHEFLAASGGSHRYGTSPSFSPSGREVAYTTGFQSATRRTHAIAVIDVDARVTEWPLELSSRQWDSHNASYSPDGELVVFDASYPESPGSDNLVPGRDIFVVESDGGTPVNITRDPSRAYSHPSYSPDGSQIAYARYQKPCGGERCEPDGYWDVWVMNADGSQARRLARKASHPVFSPDGKWIAFTQVHPGLVLDRPTVDVMATDGSGKRTVDGDRKKIDMARHPTWQPLPAPSVACTKAQAKKNKLSRKVGRLKKKKSRADSRSERKRYAKRVKKTRKGLKKTKLAAKYNC